MEHSRLEASSFAGLWRPYWISEVDYQCIALVHRSCFADAGRPLEVARTRSMAFRLLYEINQETGE